MTIDILCEAPLHAALNVDILRTALQDVLSDHATPGALICVLTDDVAIRKLNREFRKVDAPANVLSFDLRDPIHPDDNQIGEIYISLHRAEAQARDAGRSFQEEVVHLAVHGALHLLGFDHNTDAGSVRMQRQEVRYLERLRNSYPSRGPAEPSECQPSDNRPGETASGSAP